MLKLGRLRSPFRRVLAIDAGSRRIKLLMAESDFGRVRLVREEMIDLHAEGLVSPAETRIQLQSFLESWGRPPLALALPQHVSTSQTIDLPQAAETEVENLIREETLKLGGVSDTKIVYDFVRTEWGAGNRQQFWVTIAQEEHIRERIGSLGIEQEDICEVTTAANALITAYQAAAPVAQRAILIHLSAQSTVVIILVAGQGAYAASFQMGGDFFTRALARLSNGTEESAEEMKRGTNFFAGPEATPEFLVEVDGWIAEVKRQLNEWFEAHPSFLGEARSFKLVASGGGFDQPGFLDYLREQAELNLCPWPRAENVALAASPGYEIALGTALQALGQSAQPVSLLPEDYRAQWRRHLVQQRIQLGSFALAVLCILLLAFGTWHKMSLIERKSELLAKAREARQTWETHQLLDTELSIEYETLRPLFAAEQNTLDTLKTLALLQQTRSNQSFWYVLVADQQTYFNPPASMVTTNRSGKTNTVPVMLGPFLPAISPLPGPATNASPARPGFIAELTSPEGAESSRAALSSLVSTLKQDPLFSKVDSLSDDLRRHIAEPPVIIPEKHFALALFFSETGFNQPLTTNSPLLSTPPGPRRLDRPSWPRAASPSRQGEFR